MRYEEKNYSLASEPMDFAGWAKRLAELQIFSYKKQYDLKNYKVVRPSNVYGPGDNFDPNNAMVIPSILNRILKEENPLVVWGDGSAIRDFVYRRCRWIIDNIFWLWRGILNQKWKRNNYIGINKNIIRNNWF